MIHSSLSAMVTLGKWEGDRYIRVNFAENNTATEDFEKLSHDRNIQGDRYTAISRKVVGKSARDCPERYCGSFWVHCSSKKFERMTREAADICLWVLKESNNSSRQLQSSGSDRSPYYLSGLSRAHFSDNLSRNGCIQDHYMQVWLYATVNHFN